MASPAPQCPDSAHFAVVPPPNLGCSPGTAARSPPVQRAVMGSGPRCSLAARGLLALLLLVVLPRPGRSCEILRLENGKVVLTDTRTHMRADFSCNEGYRLIGATSAQCYKRSKTGWNESVPVCQVQCPKPKVQNGNVVNALDDKMWYHVTETIPFKCSPDYQLSNHSHLPAADRFNITCLADGNWTEIPQCEKRSTTDACKLVPKREEFMECDVPLEHLKMLLQVQKLYLEIEKLMHEPKSD